MTKPQVKLTSDELPLGPNARAAQETIDALTALGRFEPVDKARQVAFLTIARAVDADPLNATLWREYRTAEVALRKAENDSDDELTKLVGELSATVGDEPDAKRRNIRRTSRRRRDEPGP